LGGGGGRRQRISEASSCKYLGIIFRSDLSWADQVNHTVQKAWKASHFIMLIPKKGNRNTKSLVGPILEYGTSCWDSYREGQISSLDRLQTKAAKFANHTVWKNFGAELEVTSHLRPLQRIHRRTGVEGYRGRVTMNMLP